MKNEMFEMNGVKEIYFNFLHEFSEEVSQADFKVLDIYEYDEYVFLETSLGIFTRKFEDDIEYEIVRALESFNSRNDFIPFGWDETDYNI